MDKAAIFRARNGISCRARPLDHHGDHHVNPSPQSSRRIDRTRLLRWGKIVGQFTSVQLLVQALSAITGLLILRILDKDQYALFTIASSIQSTANLLTDCGINAGLLSIGGRIWKDKAAMGGLVSAALRLRMRLAIAAGLLVSPLAIWLLLRNGASMAVAIAITALVVATLQFVGATAIFAAVMKLNSSYRALQIMDAAVATSRLALVLLTSAIFINALIATLIASAAQVFQWVLSRGRAAAFFSRRAPHDVDHYSKLLTLVNDNAAFSLYVAVQGQIAVFILGVFGSTSQIADIGALTRLGVISAVITTLLNYVVSPSLAKAVSAHSLRRMLYLASGGVTVVSSLIIASCRLLPDPILWIFGPQYAHLQRELLLTAISLSMNLYLAVLWTVNTARAWLRRTWVIAPATIVLQVALAPFLQLSTVAGILWFTILSQIPNMLWSSYLTHRGLRTFAH